MRNSLNILSITTTVSNEEQAKKFSEELMNRRLAACIQISQPIRSHYRWQNQLCDEQEIRLTIKTAMENEAELLEAFEDLHPYDVPQVLIHEERSTNAYASWVIAETSPE